MSPQAAQPVNGSYGSIEGIEITESVVARLVKHAEDEFPAANFRAPGRPSRSGSPTRAITVRLSDAELKVVMERADRENLSRSDAIREALAQWVAS